MILRLFVWLGIIILLNIKDDILINFELLNLNEGILIILLEV